MKTKWNIWSLFHKGDFRAVVTQCWLSPCALIKNDFMKYINTRDLWEKLPSLLSMNSADTVSGSVKGHDAPILERNRCFSSFFNVSEAFVCSSCRAWLMKLRYEVPCAPQHSLLGKMLPPCKDHPLTVSLKWWLGWLRKHDFMRRERPEWEGFEAVELLVEKYIKPQTQEGNQKLWTRCDTAKSIHFQSSHELLCRL